MNGSVSIQWLGNDGWVIDLFGTTLVTDLDLFTDIRLPLDPVSSIEKIARRTDIYLVTHAHGDHFNTETACIFLEKSECDFVIPESCYSKALTAGIPNSRIMIASPGRSFTLGNIYIEPVRAVHGHIYGSVYSGASLLDCGYIIEKNAFRIYQPGDTLLLEEHLDMKGINLAFVSPTEHNMGIKNAVHYLTSLDPDIIIPQHFNSYKEAPDNAFWTHGYTDELYKALPETLRNRFIRFDRGETKTLNIKETCNA